jgi:hypothetical protein
MEPARHRVVTVPDNDRFNYRTLEPDLAEKLQQQAERIRQRIGKTTEAIIEIGRDLLAVKQSLGHGHFVTWVETEVGISKRTAQVYMAAARFADGNGKSAIVALLPPTTLHRLTAKSAPEEVVDAVLSRVEAGQVVPDRAVATMIAETRAHQKKTNGEQERREHQSKRPQEHLQAEHLAEEQRRAEVVKVQKIAENIFTKLGPDLSTLVADEFEKVEVPGELIRCLREMVRSSFPDLPAFLDRRQHSATADTAG